MKSYWQINNDIDLRVLLFVPQAIDIDYCHGKPFFLSFSTHLTNDGTHGNPHLYRQKSLPTISPHNNLHLSILASPHPYDSGSTVYDLHRP
jgi:hypothetical protein